MIRSDQIPDEVVMALQQCLNGCDCDECLAAYIAAALNAWPDVVDTNPNNIGHLVLQFKESQDE